MEGGASVNNRFYSENGLRLAKSRPAGGCVSKGRLPPAIVY